MSPARSATSACSGPVITSNGSIPIIATIAINYLYSERELAGWKERIQSVAERAQKTYVITNNHFESKAGVNALELKAMITGKRVLAPPTLMRNIQSSGELPTRQKDSGEDSNRQLSLLA